MRAAFFGVMGLVCLSVVHATLAAPAPQDEDMLVQPWWPCTSGPFPSPEMAQLMVEHNKVFDKADRDFEARPGTTRAVVDANVCLAESDPEEAARLARVYDLRPGWTDFKRKQEAAVIAYAALKARRGAERVAAPMSTWFTYNAASTQCFESRSPADRIAEIQSRGHTARTEDYGDPSRPTKVDVIDDLGAGRTTVYTYWRSLQACEAELPGNRPIAPKYR